MKKNLQNPSSLGLSSPRQLVNLEGSKVQKTINLPVSEHLGVLYVRIVPHN